MTANDNNVLTPDFKEIETKNPDEGLRQGLFEAQAARIVELQAEIASRQEEIDNLKSLILDSHPVGTYQAGNLKVQVKPGARRINAGTFEKAYPATKYPGAYQLRPRPLSQLEKLLSADASTRPYANWRRRARPVFPCIRCSAGIRRQPSRRRMTGPTRCASTTPAKRLQSKASTRPHWPTSRKPSTTFSRR